MNRDQPTNRYIVIYFGHKEWTMGFREVILTGNGFMVTLIKLFHFFPCQMRYFIDITRNTWIKLLQNHGSIIKETNHELKGTYKVENKFKKKQGALDWSTKEDNLQILLVHLYLLHLFWKYTILINLQNFTIESKRLICKLKIPVTTKQQIDLEELNEVK